jgi:hypothetical protein
MMYRVYGIYDRETLLYIGKTCQPLSKRLEQHKANSGSSRLLKRYLDEQLVSRPSVILSICCFKVCLTPEDLSESEQEFIRVLKPPCNVQHAIQNRLAASGRPAARRAAPVKSPEVVLEGQV